MATKTRRLSELTIDEIRFQLKKRGLSADGSEDPLRQRLRKVLMEESTAIGSEGSQDKKTASADNRRNADGILKQKEEFDLEVLVDDFEMCGGSRDSLKEGVSKTPETGDKGGGEERKESESDEKQKNSDTPKSTSALWISGLTSAAKASALKAIFSKYGQVNAAKVMASSKSEGKWFGLVVMSSPEEALLCIQNVNNTQFQDDVITVEFDPKQRGATVPQQQTSKEADSRQSDEEPQTSLWVTGLPVTTKAADLKEIFGKFGEVVHAKVAASKNDESKGYFGIVTMMTIEEADACVENLNQTEIKDSVITVEKKKRHSSKPRTMPSSRHERPERRDWSPPPYERDRFYDSRGGFRGRRFPPRPYMGRGRGFGFRGRGREPFMHMDHRSDYDRHMEHGRHQDDERDREFYQERGRYSGRPAPFDRSWDHPRGGFNPRGMSDHEPYWGQAAKRPRFNDDMPPRDRRQMEPDDRFHSERRGMMDERRGIDDRRGMMDTRRGMMDNRRGMMDDRRGMMDDRRGMMDDRGSYGGSGGYSDSRNPVSDKPMLGEVANEKRDFGMRPDNRMSSRNLENPGGNARVRSQWHSSGNTTATNDSTGYQTGPPVVSNYSLSQPNYSGMDSSALGSYAGSTNNSFAGSSKPNTFEMPGRNQHSNTGGSYGATSSSSFSQSIHGEAGGGSFGATGGSSFGATGSGSFGAAGGSSFGATSGSSFGAKDSSSFGATGGSSFGATGSGSFGATGGGSFGATGGGSFGATGGGSFGAKDSSSFGATGGSSFGGNSGSSFRTGGSGGFGGASGGSFGRAGGNAFKDSSGSPFGRTAGGAISEGGGSSFERMGTMLSRDSAGMNNRAPASGSYVGEGSSFQGTAGNLSGGTGGGGYGGMGGGSSIGGATGGSSLRESGGGNSFGGGISLGQGGNNSFTSAVGGSFGGASGNVLGGTRDNSYRVTGPTSYGLTGDNSYVGKESSSYGGALHSLYSEAGSNTYAGVEARSHAASGSGSYGGSLTGASLGIPGNSSFTAGGSGSYGGKLGNSYEVGPGGGSYGSSNLMSVGGASSSSNSFGASSSYFSQGGSSYSYSTTTMFDGSNQYVGGTGTSFATSGGGTTGAMNAPQSQYSAYNLQGGSGQTYPWY